MHARKTANHVLIVLLEFGTCGHGVLLLLSYDQQGCLRMQCATHSKLHLFALRRTTQCIGFSVRQ